MTRFDTNDKATWPGHLEIADCDIVGKPTAQLEFFWGGLLQYWRDPDDYDRAVGKVTAYIVLHSA